MQRRESFIISCIKIPECSSVNAQAKEGECITQLRAIIASSERATLKHAVSGKHVTNVVFVVMVTCIHADVIILA